MKKRIAMISALCALMFGTIVGVSACSSQTPILPEKPGGTETPSEPSKDPETPPSGSDKEPETPSGPSAPTILDRAKKLAENIDNLPDMSAIENVGGTSKNKAVANAASRAADRAIVDLSTPASDNVNDYDSHYGQQIEFINGMIEGFKSLKDDAVDVCRQLGVWVKSYANSYEYKVSYDKQTDTVTVERRNGQHTEYFKATSSYNVSGQMKIAASSTSANETDVFSVGVDYTEGESWTCAYYEPQINTTFNAKFRYLVHADLTSSERRISKLSLNEIVTTDPNMPDYGEVEKTTRRTIITDYHDMPIVIELSPEDLDNMTNKFEVYDANGGLLLNNGVLNNNVQSLELNLYMADGWDKAYYYPDESADSVNHAVRLKIGDNEYGGWGTQYYYDGEGSSAWYLRASTYYQGQRAKPLIVCSLKDRQSYVEFLNNWGLSIKPEYEDDVKYLLDEWDYDAFLRDWDAFGFSSFVYARESAMYEKFDEISADLQILSREDFDAVTAEFANFPAIDFADQTVSNEIYESVDVDISGKVSVSDGLVFDLSAVKCDVPATILLEEGGLYTLETALVSDNDFKALSAISAEYVRTGITIDGLDANAALPDLVENERYVLVAYLAKTNGSDKQRISDYTCLAAVAPTEYSTVSETYSVRTDVDGAIVPVKTASGTTVDGADIVTVERVHKVEDLPEIVPVQNGDPEFDGDALSLKLGNVRWLYGDTPLLADGDECTVKIELVGKDDAKTLAEKIVIVDGGLEAVFDDIDLKISDAAADESYEFVLKLYKTIDEDTVCVSSRVLTSSEMCELSFHVEEELDGVTTVYDGKFVCMPDGMSIVFYVAETTE